MMLSSAQDLQEQQHISEQAFTRCKPMKFTSPQLHLTVIVLKTQIQSCHSGPCYIYIYSLVTP